MDVGALTRRWTLYPFTTINSSSSQAAQRPLFSSPGGGRGGLPGHGVSLKLERAGQAAPRPTMGSTRDVAPDKCQQASRTIVKWSLFWRWGWRGLQTRIASLRASATMTGTALVSSLYNTTCPRQRPVTK